MFSRRIGLAAASLMALMFAASADADTQEYVYDADGRLIGVEYDTGAVIEYPLDDIGNRTGVNKNASAPSVLAFTVSTVTVSETAGYVDLAVSRSGGSGQAINVTCQPANGTALAGSDYTGTAITRDWAAGETGTQTCRVPITNDAVGEPTETFRVDLVNPTNGAAIGGPSFVTVSIADDDSVIALASTGVSVAEHAGSATVTINRTGTNAASVVCSTANGVAAAGSDYTSVSLTVHWPEGDSSPKSCTVPITDDTGQEADEPFTVRLSSSSGAVLGSPDTATITILDNDSTVQLETATASVGEGASSISLSITRTGTLRYGASVTCATSDGTARAGSDYTAVNVLLNWGPDDGSTRTCTVPMPVNDTTVEGDETFTVRLLNPSGATVGAQHPVTTVTIADDDSTVHFLSAEKAVSEGGGSVLLLVRRTGSGQYAATVRCSTANGTAQAGSDYTAVDETLAWAAGDTTVKECWVPIINDSTLESDENFTVTLSNPTGGVSVADPSAVDVTITDDESGIAFANATVSVVEGAGSVSLSVVRIGSSSQAASVTCSTSNGSAAAGSDYTTTNQTVSWTAGSSATKTCTVPILNDSMIESDETFTVSLANPSPSGLVLGGPATVTILEDDSRIAFSSSSVSVSEGAGSAVLTLVRTGSDDYDASVTCSTSNGTATAGSDYSTNNQTVTWAAGTSGAKTCSVPILNDSTIESDETFTVSLTNPNPSGLILGGPATVTILEDDSGVAFTSSTASVSEGAGSIVLTLVRTGSDDYPASVTCATSNGTAAAGSDYTATNQTVTWAAGGTATKTCSIPILNDSTVESDETFTVSLTNPNPSGLVLGGPATVTIQEDDSRIAFSSSAISVSEGDGSVVLTLERTGAGDYAASVTCSTSDGTATASGDYTATSATVTWAAGTLGTKTCTVPVLEDSAVEADEIFTVSLTNPNPSGLILGGPATVTIIDNDSGVAFGSSTASVSEGDGSVALTLVRAGSNDYAASVTCTTSNGSAAAGSDYTATNATVTWAAGTSGAKTCSVPILNDSTIESDETFTVSLTNSDPANLATGDPAIVTILEDDSRIAFTSSTAAVPEGAGSVVLTLVRTGSDDYAASVNCTTSNGTALSGSDYTATNVSVSWAAGTSGTKTCSIPILNDSTNESNETFTVSLTNPNPSGLTLGNAGTVTIHDNDTPSVLAFNSSSYSKLENLGGESKTITVTRTGGTGNAVSVQYSTQNGTAVAGSDYGAANGTLTWAAGDTSSKSFTVSVYNDSTPENDEYFLIVLSGPTGNATLGSPASASVEIPCNDGYSACN